jgi:site-specific DNA-methyltransferase (adenine-specific)
VTGGAATVSGMRVMHAHEVDAAATIELTEDLLIHADNASVLPKLADGSFDLIYIDPPFNTGRLQRKRTLSAERDEEGGERVGFGGRRYRTRLLADLSFDDDRREYLDFIVPRLEHARRLLAVHGTLYLHLDYREAHYCKLALDEIFGRECFLNEIVWAYDFGGKPKRRWPAKHDTILVYVRAAGRHHFDSEAVEREPYMAPGLVTPEKARRGKMPVDTWWHTIVPTNGSEKTGYPTQKPEGIVRRIVAASSRPGGWCMDFFAGSGTLGAVCAAQGRRFVLVDHSQSAIAIAARRLAPSRQLATG